MSATQIIDDEDTNVAYGHGNWQHNSDYNAYSSTVTCTNDGGATATVPFFGTQVKVVGFLVTSGKPMESSYRIDNGPETSFSPILPSLPEYTKVFYVSPLLTLGHHTLLITNKRESGSLYLDYYEVSSPPTPPTDVSPLSITSSTPSPVSTVAPGGSTSANPTSGVISASGSNAPASTITPLQVDAHHSTYTQRYSLLSGQQSLTVTVTIPTDASGSGSSSIAGSTFNARAALIGGILGSLMLLLLISGLSIFLWKRRRNCRVAPSSMFRSQYSTRLPDDPLPFTRY